MSDLSMQDRVELEVTDFGPIVEAMIELRPLTVFIGPSNTGKSWLAILIYALHRYFSGSAWLGRYPTFRGSRLLRSNGRKKPQQETIDSLIECARQILDKKNAVADEGIVLPDTIAALIRSHLNEQGNQLGDEISRAFGIEQRGMLIRKEKRAKADVTIRTYTRNDLLPVEHKLTLGVKKTTLKTEISEKIPIQIDDDDSFFHYIEHIKETLRSGFSEAENSEAYYLYWHFFEEIAEHSLSHIFGPLYLPAFYLPADRTGVMHAHSAVVSAMIGNAPMAGLRPSTRTPMLSGVLTDFLQQLIGIDQIDRSPHMKRKSHQGLGKQLGKQIEEKILGGAVTVHKSDSNIDYPRFTYRPKGWKDDDLPLMNASSMVSELAPVVLYLRHMVEPRNVLIIEEPESHLHPSMQVEFTQQLAAVVRSGVRVIITTHSEWVLDELANIVRSSDLTKTSRQGISAAKVALRPDQVGAWLFEPKRRPKGSMVRELKLDDETGLYPTDYDVAREMLYNENDKIFNRIQDSKAE